MIKNFKKLWKLWALIIFLSAAPFLTIFHGCGQSATAPSPPIEMPSAVWVVNTGAKSTATTAGGEASLRLVNLSAIIVEAFLKDVPAASLTEGMPQCTSNDTCQELGFFVNKPICHKDDPASSTGFCTIECNPALGAGECAMFGGAACATSSDSSEGGICRAPESGSAAKPCNASSGDFVACSSGNHTVLSCFDERVAVNKFARTEPDCAGSADPECAGPFNCEQHTTTLIVNYDQCVPKDNLGVIVNTKTDMLALSGLFQGFVQVNPICGGDFATCTTTDKTKCPCVFDDDCVASGTTDPNVRCAVIDGVGTCEGSDKPCRVTDDCIKLTGMCEPPSGTTKFCRRISNFAEEIKTADHFGMGPEDPKTGKTSPFAFETVPSNGTLSMDFGPMGYTIINADETLDKLFFKYGGDFIVDYQKLNVNDQQLFVQAACKACLVSSVMPKHCCCQSADTTKISDTEACDLYNKSNPSETLTSCKDFPQILDPNFDPCTDPEHFSD